MILRRVPRFVAYAVMVAVGSFVAIKAAPDIESLLFPISVDIYMVPFDPARPDVMVDRQLDRVCWRQHVHKLRAGTTKRWALTIIAHDGTRYFTEVIDARTGESFSSKDAYPGGYNGFVAFCALIPDGLDTTEGFKIESFSQYEPRHGLWYIDQGPTVITVPPLSGASK